MFLNTYMANPRISVCVPTHDMKNGEYFIKRLVHSLIEQSFQDFELVMTEEGRMAENTNAAIKRARGDIIKVLYMDDFLFNKDALQHIANVFEKGTGWYASGCVHTPDGIMFERPHIPSYNDAIRFGNNTIGSPSVVAFENDDPILFDERLSWLLDCDLYGKLYKRYGAPILSNELDIAIGVGPHQMTNILTDKDKNDELIYLRQKP